MSAQDEYELIFEGLTDDSDGARTTLRQALERELVSQVFETEALLDGGPFLLRRSSDKVGLEAHSRDLTQAGARVLIVRARERRKEDVIISNETAEAKKGVSSIASFMTKYVNDLHRVLQQLDSAQIEDFARDLLLARERGGQIFIFGNGGSASSASHFANDFSKERFDDDSLRFRVMSLNDNVAWLSATANDFGYEYVFVNQLKNLLRPGDVVIGISSSGNSPNIVRAIDYAKANGAATWGIVGFTGGELMQRAQRSIYIPTKVGQYGFMEDVTLVINHIVSVYIYEQDRARVAM